MRSFSWTEGKDKSPSPRRPRNVIYPARLLGGAETPASSREPENDPSITCRYGQMNERRDEGEADAAWSELGDDEARPGYSMLRRFFVPATAAIVAFAVVVWLVGGADGGESLARDIILLALVATAGGCFTLVRRWWDPLPLGYVRAASGNQRRVGELLALAGVAAVGVGIVVMVVAAAA